MLEAIQNRTSRRSFEKETLEEQEIKMITSYISELNEKSHLTMELWEDGSEAFSNLAKTYGLFHNVRSLVVMKGDKKDPDLKEKVGYYGEDLVLKLTEMKLGTCWVGGTFEKDKFKLKEDEELVCVIVLGKVKEMSLKEKTIRAMISKKRKPLTERFITDTDQLPDWFLRGIESVILAPSAKNTQKTMFEYHSGNVYAMIPDDYHLDLVDLGIAKKHFEMEAGGVFELGNKKMFHIGK